MIYAILLIFIMIFSLRITLRTFSEFFQRCIFFVWFSCAIKCLNFMFSHLLLYRLHRSWRNNGVAILFFLICYIMLLFYIIFLYYLRDLKSGTKYFHHFLKFSMSDDILTKMTVIKADLSLGPQSLPFLVFLKSIVTLRDWSADPLLTRRL